MSSASLLLPVPSLFVRFCLLCVALASALDAQSSQRAVLVTGASSGLGRRITERLAANNYIVFAGARAQADLDALNAIRNVRAIRLDVTVARDIDAAVATIKAAGLGLWGVVNNAGVVGIAPLAEISDAELDFVFGVNVYGPVRVTRAFVPMLIESRGRVVNISSLNGIVASSMIGAYSMSKHAIEAFGDGLSSELQRFGVRVSLIEPGNYGSEIGKNMFARLDTVAMKGSRFEAQMRNTMNAMRTFETGVPPDDVADAVLDAVSSPNPRMRYLVVPAANQATIVLRTLFDHIAQMNDSQKFRLERDSLVKMLDDALSRVRSR